MSDIEHFLRGDQLYGDDLTQNELEAWYVDETEGYAQLGASDRSTYFYRYDALNRLQFFREIKERKFNCALGLGSAYGAEFKPIARQIRDIVIIEPSGAFGVAEIEGTPIRRVLPRADCLLPVGDASVDLVLCLGVLHHIPKVSLSLEEIYRTLCPGGLVCLREPIVSMGDWRFPRPGLTTRERGIPLKVLDYRLRDLGFIVRRKALCDFRPLIVIANRTGRVPFNSAVLSRLDAVLSQLFRWNYVYHRKSAWRKFAPASISYVLQKPAA